MKSKKIWGMMSIFKRAIFIPQRTYRIGMAAFLLFILGLAVVWGERPVAQVASYAVANRVIVIDPGHGGFDPGAQRGEFKEKEITLAISRKLEQNLSKAGAMVILLRDSDESLSDSELKGSLSERKRQDLGRRVEKANEAKADLYISIHANADPSPRWRGAQTFYNKNSTEAKLLAESIQQELTAGLGNTNRKALAGNYYIIDKTKMPAVIVEVGFLSNPEEARLLSQPDYQQRVATAIFTGITKYQANLLVDKQD